MFEAPKNLETDSFLDPVGPFETNGTHFGFPEQVHFNLNSPFNFLEGGRKGDRRVHAFTDIVIYYKLCIIYYKICLQWC